MVWVTKFITHSIHDHLDDSAIKSILSNRLLPTQLSNTSFDSWQLFHKTAQSLWLWLTTTTAATAAAARFVPITKIIIICR